MSAVAIVLAGGASTRFGRNKLGAELDGRPLLQHALEACAAVAPAIVLVLAPDAPLPALPPPLEDRVVVTHDRAAHRGPLAGLAAGLERASSAAPDADTAILVGGDMPSLQPDVLGLLLDRLAASAADHDPRPDAVRLEAEPAASLPLAVRISPAQRAAAELLGAERRSLHALLDRLRTATVDASTWRALDPDGRTIADIDTPDDLATESRRRA
jgi:molybdopterin-guanine dinucleotide biosynthesis protein A